VKIENRKPELEQFVIQEILRGHFESVDDPLTGAFQALREKRTRKNLAQFLLESPFASSDLPRLRPPC
jgi:hypothetical protein